MMSNSASAKGGATLFLTILTFTWLPMALPAASLRVSLAADVNADAGVELQRLAAGRGFGVAEHDADLLAQLVGEDAGGLGLGQNGGELAQRLAHQAGLHAHGGHAHLAFQFGLGHQRGHGINHNDIQRVGAGQRFADTQAPPRRCRAATPASRRGSRRVSWRRPGPARARRQ